MKALPLVLALCAAGCAATPSTSEPAAAVRLEATLTTPVDVRLEWTGAAPGTTGQIVEFATAPEGPWTILRFLPATRRGYDHPDLMPRTPFYYRVRALHGPASAPVDVRFADVPYPETTDVDVAWADPRRRPGTAAGGHALRGGDPAAAPAALAARVMSHDAVLFTWRDNAADEDGYLVEVRPEGAAEWDVAMMLDPDVTSVGLTALPRERRAAFRVRVYYHGASSNVVHRTTGEGR
ncbi:hypothetical protein ACTMTJ_15945 [Phytohabitans sp. LJ34]|uniref:hypothetical protein n=1 Tax=Phytohabitans sp. LJ34 TaxID=3452217 RepID=UPI003F893A7D